MKKFKKHFNTHLSIATYVASIISVVFGVISQQLFTNESVPLKYFVLYVLISLFAYWLLLIIIFADRDPVEDLTVLKFMYSHEYREVICIIKPNKQLSIDCYITIFHIINEIETYFATATVTNIQQNGIVVAIINHVIDDESSKQSLDNNVDFLNRLVLKPIVTKNYI